MKNARNVLILFMTVFPVFSIQPMAADNWWEKAVGVISGSDGIQAPGELSSSEIADAFKQALSIGSQAVVSRLGGVDGFNADPAIHIPLPGELNRVKTILATVRMSHLVDDLELKLNRAAESATPIAKELFLQAISEMTFTDVMEIYQGPKDSATSHFREQMSQSLSSQMRPIVAESLSQVGAIQSFEQVVGRYQEIPFVPDVSADLTEHVVSKGMDGIFFYIAKEEAAIREDPLKQTTDLLKKVFGTK